MIGGVLGDEDIIEMRVEYRKGLDIPSDHKLIWVHIAGRGGATRVERRGTGQHGIRWTRNNAGDFARY